MRRHTKYALATSCLLALVIENAVFAGEIFHWVDEDGVLTFSDWAPENSNVQVAKLTVSDSNPPDYNPNEDQNSILEQAERMNVRWTGLKEQQDERRKQRVEREEQQRRYQPVVYDYPWYNDSFFYYRPVHRPGIGHRRPFKVQKRQFGVLDQLRLTGVRPHSINSSAHLARINAGKTLKGNFQPHHPAKMHRAATYKEW